MANKIKGANAERELFHMLDSKGFACVRVAGSGMMENTYCDLMAGSKEKKIAYAIECKVTKNDKKYFDPEQIKNLIEFSSLFGVNPLVAIKFNRKGWHFIHPDQLTKTGKGMVISLEDIKKKGITI